MIQIDLTFVFIFFIYGLAFFSMGLTTLMEALRSSVREARILYPLAVFGLVHGLHEWLTMIFQMHKDLFIFFPYYWEIIRILMLAFSFATLIGYGVQLLTPNARSSTKDLNIGTIMLAIYITTLFAIGSFPTIANTDWVNNADIVARYILATPGALLASVALNQQSKRFQKNEQTLLATNMKRASIGFSLYAITQFLGPTTNLIIINYLQDNSFSNFLQYIMPSSRAIIAGIITVSLLRMTQLLEYERRNELHQAQQDRIEAEKTAQIEMRKRHSLRKKLLRQTVTLQEEERAKVSRELHDETAQLLTGFTANLAALKNFMPVEKKSANVFEKLVDLSNQMSDSIHRLVKDLRPAQLDELGIHSALNQLISTTEKNLGLSIDYSFNKPCDRLDPIMETALYRVVQETLTNIGKHAQVKEAQVQLLAEKDYIKVSIIDTGKGFIPSEDNHEKGFGLLGLEERVTHIGGKFEVISQPTIGTKISAWFPLDAPCDDSKKRENE
jgi:signal transduction histidine kinase